VAVGSLTYYLMLDPISYEQAGVFRFVSASIPAFLAAAIAYVLLTKLIVQPLGKGGYGGETDRETEAKAGADTEEAGQGG
jgi:nucleobase:cation symporter-1, NCS1 family